MKTMYLVLMANSWGKGETITKAAAIARHQGGHRGKQARIVYQYDPDKTPETYIDEMGSLVWKGERPVEIERTPVSKKSK